ncbi:hypothetical protein F4225_09295, partial [Candidatus Poribacteria bacterium]|nr:hypothetical protein [Candidatus Poribacteria bacterium]
MTKHIQCTSIQNGHILRFPDIQNPVAHQREIQKLTRLGKKAWIQLDSRGIQPRFHLHLLVLNFNPTQEATSIQAQLHGIVNGGERNKTTNRLDYFCLVAQPHTEETFYEISEYIDRCVAGDLSVAERLRNRTVLYIYQTEGSSYDILSEVGTSEFIDQYLVSYIRRFGVDSILGFTLEVPRFLSILADQQGAIPFTHAILQRLDRENGQQQQESTTNIEATYLPFLFYETYDSPIVRSSYWQILTSHFAQAFLKGIREFCHQQGIRFGVTVPESARSLQYDLGTIMSHTDCPILTSADGDTSRRFVVSKYICSNQTHPGINRKREVPYSECLKDASLGFNHWVTADNVFMHSKNNVYEVLRSLLQVGSPERNILMLAPTQSLWMKPDEQQWNSIIKAWGWLCQTIRNLGYDFDIVSESEFVNMRVEFKNGKIYYKGNFYRLVFLPCSISLHETTVLRLTEFTKSKGRIIANAPVPYLLNGRIGLEPYLLERLLYRRQTTILDGPENEREIDLKKYLNSFVSPRITVYSKVTDQRSESVRIHTRQDENRNLYFMFNYDQKSIETLIEIVGEFKNVIELNLRSGKEMDVDFWHANGNTYFKCIFKPET